MTQIRSKNSSYPAKIIDLCANVYEQWANIPKSLKLPIMGLSVLLAPKEYSHLRTLASLAFVAELAPLKVAQFLLGRPIGIQGKRLQLPFFESSFPSDPQGHLTPLTDLDLNIGKFERQAAKIQNASALEASRPTTIAPSSPPPLEPTALSRASAMEEATNQKLGVLSEKLSNFGILKAMHAVSGLSDADDIQKLLPFADSALAKNPAGESKLSPWRFFCNHYSDKIGWFGWIKAALTYLFLYAWVPIIPKTVDAYMKGILQQLRVHLKEDSETRKKFINGLLEEADNFLDLYNGAAVAYAEDVHRKGSLTHYRRAAVDGQIFEKSQMDAGKSPEELKKELYRKLSHSIMDHFAPKISFGGIIDGFLNWIIQKKLRDTILPEAFRSASEGGKESTQKHNIPFFLALTRTLRSQIYKMQGNMMEPGASDADTTPVIGGSNFASIVKKLLWAIDVGDCKTAEDMKAKIKQLEAKKEESAIEADVRDGIEKGVQKGLAVLFDYLSKQENTEELFEILFDSLIDPLSGKLPMSDKQWKEIEIEYEGAKILLKQSAFVLFKQIVQEAVQERVEGGSPPQRAERIAQEIFAEHRKRGQETFEEMLSCSNKLQEKIHKSNGFATEENAIYAELATIVSVLKTFENEERVKMTLEQDPAPKIAKLPPADQEAIQHGLFRFYEGAKEAMEKVLRLQEGQKEYANHTLIVQCLQKIGQIFEEIAQSDTPSLSQMMLLQDTIVFLESKVSQEAFPELKELKLHSAALLRTVTQHADEQKSLQAADALLSDKGPLAELLLYVQNTPSPGFKKNQCIGTIKELIKTVTPLKGEQEQLFLLLEKLNKYSTLPHPLPHLEEEICKPLFLRLEKHKEKLLRNRQSSEALFRVKIPQTSAFAAQRHAEYEQRLHQNWMTLNAEAADLQTQVTSLLSDIKYAEREKQLRPTPTQLGQIGGVIGFLANGALTVYTSKGAAISGAVGAGSAWMIRNLSYFASDYKWKIYGALSTAMAGIAGYYAAASLSQQSAAFSDSLPLFVGGAAAAAGLEYAASRFHTKYVSAGVSIVRPKVEKLFDKAYENFLMEETVINAAFDIVMKQVVKTFPPR